MAEVIWHLADGWWDTALPKYILVHAGITKHTVGIENCAPTENIGILMIPGRHSLEHYDDLNRCAEKFKKVVFFIYGDEEGCLHSDWLKHPDKRIWWAMPPFAHKQAVDVPLVNGWTTNGPEMIAKARANFPNRIYDWSFYGQMTHIRRVQCVDALQEVPNGELLITPGFTQGVPQEKYFEIMVQSKFVPCPSGPCTPDSFRFAEALEAGCVPIADNLIQHTWFPPGYWDYIFGDGPKPFRVVENWRELPQIIESNLPYWKDIAQNCSVWWSLQKKILVKKMKKELEL